MTQWLKNAIFYEIYPQSFMDANDDGIGDLQGIISKLDYIRELGCNAIWINPCFDSPFMDAGYDVADYYKIAPRYGTNEDARQLFDEAHKRGMHVLLDLVPGHTSHLHPWFLESMKAERNEYTDRYVWTDDIWNAPEGFATLRGISDRDGCAVTNFFSTQPALNYGFYHITEKWQQSPEDEGPRKTLEEVIHIIRFWLEMGCDGFRVDMAGSLVKNDPDSLGTIALWQKVRAFLDREFPDAAFVSEWGEPDKSLMGGFHMDFLLHFGPSHYNDLFRCEHPYFARDGKGVVSDFVKKYVENYTKTDGRGLICIPSGNHDMNRLSFQLDEEERKLAFAFLLSMPGAPFLYYGDEIGMNYLKDLKSLEGGYSRTGSRTPMQWDNSQPNAGFSRAEASKLYLPQDPREDRPAVSTELQREDSLLNEIRKLIGIRQSHIALQNEGAIRFVDTGREYPLAYVRSAGEERILAVINPSETEVSVKLPEEVVRCLYAYDGKEVTWDGDEAAVPGVSAGFYLLK